MKAAIVLANGTPPVYGEFASPELSADLSADSSAQSSADHQIVTVKAAALSRVTRARAAGTHYSSSDIFPFVPGVDGTGHLANGQRVYFVFPEAPFGAMAERTLVARSHCIALPDTLGDTRAAAIAIPGMSSYAALIERARFVRGETVLINGATGDSGRLAVRIAKYLGAGKVIATGRNAASLDALRQMGADHTVSLMQDDVDLQRELAMHCREGVDIVLDYVWGPSARATLIAAAKALPDGYPLRFVQIGSIGGAEIALPAAVLRSTAITLLGSGIGSVPMPRLLHALEAVFDIAIPAGLDIDTTPAPLEALSGHWAESDGGRRVVFTV